MILEMFISLSVWFVCKSTPLEKNNIGIFILRHLTTIVVMTTIWIQIAMLYSEGLNHMQDVTFWREQFNTFFPVLLVTGFFIYFLSALLSYLLLAIEETRRAEQENLQIQLKASQAEIRFLKSTIHPHFLFNSFTALNILTKKSPETAQQVCQQLAEFLRYSLTYSNKENVTVKEELDHINNYLGVEKIRLGSRLRINFDVDKTLLDKTILSFSLQPLIENSVKHGIEPTLTGGEISVILKCLDDNIFIQVSNPYDKNSIPENSTGHGLSNLKLRLNKFYSEEAKILVHRGESVFSVKMYLPHLKENP
jgi:LytS/YehU family sensor histidine kinase